MMKVEGTPVEAFMAGLKNAQKRTTDKKLVELLTLKLSKSGFCTIPMHDTWIIVTKRTSDVRVQLELGEKGYEHLMTIVLLEENDEDYRHYFPLGGTFAIKSEVSFNEDNLDWAVETIEKYFDPNKPGFWGSM